MSLWTPPGADLGEFAPPEPDPIMIRFIGGLDDNGRELPMTYRRLKEIADAFVITSITPEGPANLLDDAREMFALSLYRYSTLAHSAATSIFAVEAALKLRLGRKGTFETNIQLAKERGLISDEAAEAMDDGRKIRNKLLHEGKRPQWTFGIAHAVIGASYRLVSELYPEPARPDSA